ncbi:MAG: hypothetical protein J7K53_06345, partial [Bacteroidales bacterium]|nr:hypothetical protein [Bacteroidales bacterium]
RLIPEFLANRMRIEKMTGKNAIQVIEGPCKVQNIEVEEGFPEALLQKLNPDSNEIELTYLQVFLDKVFRLAIDKDKEKPGFTNDLLKQVGDVSDLLGSFLEEQISALEDPETGLTILKSFVSVKGTKRQVSEEEIIEFSQTLGNPVGRDELKDLIQKFINLRILRDKDESGKYELRHDGLATKIYEKITLVEKELLEVKQFLENAYSQFEKRKIYLTANDLKYIAPYEDKLFLNKRLEKFIEDSKKELQKAKRRKRNVAVIAAVSLIIILSGFTIWAIIEKNKATRALVEKEIAEKKLDEAAKDFVMSAENMNILYKGIENPVSFAIPGSSAGSLNFVPDIPVRLNLDENGMIITPYKIGVLNITLQRIIKNDTIILGTRSFIVKNLPPPIPTLNGKSSGFILRDSLVKTEGIKAIIPDFNFNVDFETIKYSVSGDINIGKFNNEVVNNKISNQMRYSFTEIAHNSDIVFKDIIVTGPDGVIRNLGTLSLRVVRWWSYENFGLFIYSIDEAINEKDWDKLRNLSLENIDKYHHNNIRILSEVTWDFYLYISDKEALKKALIWVRRLNELKRDKPAYLDTYAALLYKLGRVNEAITIQEKAIRIAKEKGEPTIDLENFLEKIKNSK